MPNITKIKAKSEDKTPETKPTAKSPKKASKKLDKKSKKEVKEPGKIRKFFRVITTPFRAIGRYFRDSWRELRQVRWPNRKLTWKMTAAVLAYTALFIIIITLLDVLFSLIFNKIIGA